MTARTTITAVLAAVAAASTLAAAAPADAQAGPTLRVSYQPQELRTDAGAAAVFDRIQRGARRVCLADPSVAHYATVRRCRTELIDLAVAKLANPRVAGLHAGGAVRVAAR